MCFVTGGSQIAFRGNSPSNAPVLQTANLENVLIAEDPLSTLLTLSTLLPLRSPRRLLPRRRPPAPPHASEVHASEVHASEVHARRQHQTRPRHAPRQRQDVNASPPGDVRGRRVAQRGRRFRPERRTRHRDEQDRRRDERERRAGPRRYRPADAPVRGELKRRERSGDSDGERKVEKSQRAERRHLDAQRDNLERRPRGFAARPPDAP